MPVNFSAGKSVALDRASPCPSHSPDLARFVAAASARGSAGPRRWL